MFITEVNQYLGGYWKGVQKAQETARFKNTWQAIQFLIASHKQTMYV